MFIPHCSRYGNRKVQIRFTRNQAGLFEVKSLYDGKSIVVFPATIRRVLKIDPRTSVGCAEITGLQANLIGFTAPKRMRRAVAV